MARRVTLGMFLRMQDVAHVLCHTCRQVCHCSARVRRQLVVCPCTLLTLKPTICRNSRPCGALATLLWNAALLTRIRRNFSSPGLDATLPMYLYKLQPNEASFSAYASDTQTSAVVVVCWGCAHGLEKILKRITHLSIVVHAVFAFASSAPPAFFISTSLARSFSATALVAADGRETHRRVPAAGSGCAAFDLTILSRRASCFSEVGRWDEQLVPAPVHGRAEHRQPRSPRA